MPSTTGEGESPPLPLCVSPLCVSPLSFCSSSEQHDSRGTTAGEGERLPPLPLYVCVSRLSPPSRAREGEGESPPLPLCVSPVSFCCSSEQHDPRGATAGEGERLPPLPLFLCVSRLLPSVALQSNTSEEEGATPLAPSLALLFSSEEHQVQRCTRMPSTAQREKECVRVCCRSSGFVLLWRATEGERRETQRKRRALSFAFSCSARRREATQLERLCARCC